MRISEHPIIESYNKGRKVTFSFDGKELSGYEGESIAAALKAAGVMVHRYTAKQHKPRGIFCAIGRCTDCYDCQWRPECAYLCDSIRGRHADSDTIWCRTEEGGLRYETT